MEIRPFGYKAVMKLLDSLDKFVADYDDMIYTATVKHKKKCSQLEQNYNNCLYNIETDTKKNISVIRQNGSQMIDSALEIKNSVDYMADKLTQTDKYYRKYIESNIADLEKQAIKKYQIGTVDYITTLKQMEDDYHNISWKYTTQILPAIINGLNYAFSKSRKKDYEELCILNIGVKFYIEELQTAIPDITNEMIKELQLQSNKAAEEAKQRYNNALYQEKECHADMMSNILENLIAELNVLFLKETITKMFEITEHFMSEIGTIHTGTQLECNIFHIQWLQFPINIKSPFLKKAVTDKFHLLIINNTILFPYGIYPNSYRTFFLNNNILSTKECYNFIYSMMYGVMSLIPVGKLQFDVIDEVNHGNSVSPFFNAKKMIPYLFDNEFCISREQITKKINQLNLYVENTIQNVLGTKYETIFHYAEENNIELPNIHFLLCFDFPNTFDEKTLSNLSNIVINGNRCGIFTLLMGSDKTKRMGRQNEYVTKILQKCRHIEKNMSISKYNTLQINMPNECEFNTFISKYLLAYENIQNRGIAFISIVNKLINIKDISEIKIIFNDIMKKFSTLNHIGEVPKESIPFPSELIIGNVIYPSTVFEGTLAEDAVRKTFGTREGGIALPFSLQLCEKSNIFIESSEQNKYNSNTFIKSIIWSFISAVPVTKANVSVIDTKGHGSSIGDFMKLSSQLPQLFDNGICVSGENIINKLNDINSTIDERIQKKLKGVFENILAYNIATPTRPESLHLLVIYDFPNNFDNRSIKLLENILENGSKCGIFTIICYDPTLRVSKYDTGEEQIEKLKSFCNVISANNIKLSLQPYNLEISVADISAVNQERFSSEYAELSDKINKRGISIDDILDKKLFGRYSVPELQIPIGIGDEEKIINLEIGGKGSSHHLLIGGGIGGGKSTLMHTIIMSSLLHYRPDDLNLYLLDFKEGVEFKIYDNYKIPHIRLLAVDAMQEFGLSILKYIIKEIEIRSELCKNTTPQSTGFSSYRRNKNENMSDMPRIMLIMDEFQILYNPATNRKVADECANLTKRIVTEGRSYGIHLIMATQSMNILRNLPLESGTIEQMRIRIGLKCGENDARYLFSDKNDKDSLKRMKGPIGTAVMNHDYTEEDNIGLRVAYCNSKRQEELLSLIQKNYKDIPCDCRTFEGSSVTHLLDYFRNSNIHITDELPCTIHMGTKIEVAPPFAIHMDRRSKHNILICGTSDETTSNIVNNYIISAVINKNSEIYCFDGDVIIGETIHDAFYSVVRNFSSAFHLAESYSDIVSFILKIKKIFEERKKKRSFEPVFVIIKNLQYLELVQKMLRSEIILTSEYLEENEEKHNDNETFNNNNENNNIPDTFRKLAELQNTLKRHNSSHIPSDSSNSNTNDENVSKALINLISNGSNFGIYFLVTSFDLQTIKENMRGVIENTYNKFSEHIVHSLGSDDISFIISGLSSVSIPQNIAYYSNESKKVFQFKPYTAPTAEELHNYFLNGGASCR